MMGTDSRVFLCDTYRKGGIWKLGTEGKLA